MLEFDLISKEDFICVLRFKVTNVSNTYKGIRKTSLGCVGNVSENDTSISFSFNIVRHRSSNRRKSDIISLQSPTC